MSEEPCDSCGSKGWLHMDEPFEIERCDSCGDGSDESAVRKHSQNCGCDWPPHDYQNAFIAWITIDLRYGSFHLMPHELIALFRLIRDTAAQREQFDANLDKLMTLVGRAIHEAIATPAPRRDEWIDRALSQLRGAGSILLNVRHLISENVWKKHWLLSSEHGSYDDKTGRWTAHKGDSNGGCTSGRCPNPSDGGL